MTQNAIQLPTTPPLSGADSVADTNGALLTVATDFAGSTDPTGLAGPYMTWADTGNMLFKRRNAANSAWVVEGTLLKASLPQYALADVPTTDKGPIYVIGVGNMEWKDSAYALVPIPASAVSVATIAGITATNVQEALVELGKVTVAVRQTVMSGPVDATGVANFGGSTGSATVTATGTLLVTAANGFLASGAVDRVGTITNPSWTGLTTAGINYLYLDINADGTCTPGSTTLAPAYRLGGADITTNNQFTFNYGEMVGRVGDGTIASQIYRVFVGEVDVAGGVVTAIFWYAINGQYDSGYQAGALPSAATLTLKNACLGVEQQRTAINLRCDVAEGGYSVGNIVTQGLMSRTDSDITATPILVTRRVIGFTAGSFGTGFALANANNGQFVALTRANWSYRLTAQRGW